MLEIRGGILNLDGVTMVKQILAIFTHDGILRLRVVVLQSGRLLFRSGGVDC